MRKLLHKFDGVLTGRIQAWPEPIRPLMVLASLIGQPVFTIGIGTLVAGLGWGRSNPSLLQAGIVIVATITAGSLIKLVLRRNRPLTDYVAHMRFSTFSLPSGHSVGSLVSYGTLGYLALMSLSTPWNAIAGIILGSIGLLVGISRVYLGAHYPTDVAAGWLLGAFGLGVITCMVQPAI